jgi:hypothetical protein
VNPDVVTQRVDDELVLVNLRTNKIFSLNSTGARFWDLLVSGQSKQQIIQVMAGEYDVDRETLAREIEQLRASLAAEALITGDQDG